LSKFLFFI